MPVPEDPNLIPPDLSVTEGNHFVEIHWTPVGGLVFGTDMFTPSGFMVWMTTDPSAVAGTGTPDWISFTPFGASPPFGNTISGIETSHVWGGLTNGSVYYFYVDSQVTLVSTPTYYVYAPPSEKISGVPTTAVYTVTGGASWGVIAR